MFGFAIAMDLYSNSMNDFDQRKKWLRTLCAVALAFWHDKEIIRQIGVDLDVFDFDNAVPDRVFLLD